MINKEKKEMKVKQSQNKGSYFGQRRGRSGGSASNVSMPEIHRTVFYSKYEISVLNDKIHTVSKSF